MKHFTRHLFSMTAAAAIGFSSVLNCGSLSALAAYEHGTTKAGKLVPVIIKLSGEAVLAGEEAAELGTDYLDTSEAEEKPQRSAGSAVKRRIHSETSIPPLKSATTMMCS